MITDMMDMALVPLTMVKTLSKLVALPGSKNVPSQPSQSHFDNRHPTNNRFDDFRRPFRRTNQQNANQLDLINLVSHPCTCDSYPTDFRRSKSKFRLVQENVKQIGAGWVNIQRPASNKKKRYH